MRRSIALDRALRAGDLTEARAALADPDAFPDAVDEYRGSTVLQLALFTAPVATVTALLDAGADPCARTRIDDLTTPADEARTAGHAAIARMLRNAEGG